MGDTPDRPSTGTRWPVSGAEDVAPGTSVCGFVVRRSPRVRGGLPFSTFEPDSVGNSMAAVEFSEAASTADRYGALVSTSMMATSASCTAQGVGATSSTWWLSAEKTSCVTVDSSGFQSSGKSRR